MDTVCQSQVSLPVDDGIAIPNNKCFMINQEVVSLRQSMSGDEMMRTFVGDLKYPTGVVHIWYNGILHGY